MVRIYGTEWIIFKIFVNRSKFILGWFEDIILIVISILVIRYRQW